MQKRIIRKKTAAKKKTAVKKPSVMKPSRKTAVPPAPKKKIAAKASKNNSLMVKIRSVFDETAAKIKTLLPGDAAGQSSTAPEQPKK